MVYKASFSQRNLEPLSRCAAAPRTEPFRFEGVGPASASSFARCFCCLVACAWSGPAWHGSCAARSRLRAFLLSLLCTSGLVAALAFGFGLNFFCFAGWLLGRKSEANML